MVSENNKGKTVVAIQNTRRMHNTTGKPSKFPNELKQAIKDLLVTEQKYTKHHSCQLPAQFESPCQRNDYSCRQCFLQLHPQQEQPRL